MKTAHRALLFAAFVMGIAVAIPTSADAAPKTHTVAAGQSLWKIAHRYHVSVDALCQENGMKEGDALRAGQVLTIPDGKAKPATKDSKAAHKAAAAPGKADPGQKSGSGLPALAKAAPAGGNSGVAERPKATHTAAKTTPKAASQKTSQHRKSAPKSAPSKKKGAGDAAAAKSAPKGSGDADEGDLRLKDQTETASAPSWVLAKPAPRTQVQKTPDQRGGVNPCMTEDPGWGVYDHWSRAPSMGQMIAPQHGGIARDGGFDVVFHFHGHEPVRKEWVKVMHGPVLVGIDLGIGSGPYQEAFRAPNVFKHLVESVEKAMAEKTGNHKAHVRKVGLSSWSAGYGAVGEIINQPYGQKLVDSVVLLDGLHCGYGKETLDDLQLEPFLRFAREAAAGHKFMFVSHSSIIPPGYASTTETANYLIQKLGGRPQLGKPRGSDPWGLDLVSRYDRGNFHVRGYSGNDKMDHCAHIGLYADILKARVEPRWHSPQGSKSDAAPAKERTQLAKNEHHGD